MKAITMTMLAVLTAVLGFAATVAWAAEEARPDLRVAETVICACLGQGNVA